MKLGLAKNEVKLLPYTTDWEKEFKRVKLEIIGATGLQGDRIQHIGSTAIINMPAKPIIDLLLGVDEISKVDKAIFKELQNIGFLRLRVERPDEIVFAKFTDETYEVKTHFIHMVDFDKELWKNQLFFRDYLNLNEKAREEYVNIKITSAKQEDININTYTDLKEPFVKSIFTIRTN
ncbi:GrpB family protein [Psychrobacillus sp. NPDC096623]|uniref:GrpB family protein n=1 Tax=Psychrobacillus sp. NPDC096623 TaxID=3364492 RepID=UPI003823A8B2